MASKNYVRVHTALTIERLERAKAILADMLAVDPFNEPITAKDREHRRMQQLARLADFIEGVAISLGADPGLFTAGHDDGETSMDASGDGESGDADTTTDGDAHDLDTMTKAALIDLATSLGLDVKASATKADLIDAIDAALRVE